MHAAAAASPGASTTASRPRSPCATSRCGAARSTARSTCSPCCAHEPPRPAALAIVLHTHMPYVEGFGTWPFGEEWLWEAIACCYLPLLDVLDAAPGRVTLSVTPVLGDQLEAPGALDRCLAFLREIRPALARARPRRRPTPAEAAALRALRRGLRAGGGRARAGDLRRAARPPRDLDLRRPRTPCSRCSPPTRASGCSSRPGIAAHRARSGGWGGGFWLPECAHAPWLDPLLAEAGVRATLRRPHRRPRPGATAPLRTARRARCSSRSTGRRSSSCGAATATRRAAPYRDTHRLTEHRHQAWAVDGGALRPGARRARRRAPTPRDFVARIQRARPVLLRRAGTPSCSACTGTRAWPWLAAVLEAADAAGLRIAPLDELAGRGGAGARRVDAGHLLGRAADARHLERAARRRARLAPAPRRAARAARREPAGRCASCSRCSPPTGRSSSPTAPRAPIRRERAAGHEAALEAALADGAAAAPALRNLAPYLASIHG